jgi:hypothetical protein
MKLAVRNIELRKENFWNNVCNSKLKSSMFWELSPCTEIEFNRHFGGTYCLHLHGRRES